MPLTLNNIEISCSQGIQIANDLSSAADRLNDCYGNGLTALGDLQAYWRGDSATAFIAKYSERLERVQTQAKALDELSAAIRKTVAVYRQTQMDAYHKQQEELKKKTSSDSS